MPPTSGGSFHNVAAMDTGMPVVDAVPAMEESASAAGMRAESPCSRIGEESVGSNFFEELLTDGEQEDAPPQDQQQGGASDGSVQSGEPLDRPRGGIPGGQDAIAGGQNAVADGPGAGINGQAAAGDGLDAGSDGQDSVDQEQEGGQQNANIRERRQEGVSKAGAAYSDSRYMTLDSVTTKEGVPPEDVHEDSEFASDVNYAESKWLISAKSGKVTALPPGPGPPKTRSVTTNLPLPKVLSVLDVHFHRLGIQAEYDPRRFRTSMAIVLETPDEQELLLFIWEYRGLLIVEVDTVSGKAAPLQYVCKIIKAINDSAEPNLDQDIDLEQYSDLAKQQMRVRSKGDLQVDEGAISSLPLKCILANLSKSFNDYGIQPKYRPSLDTFGLELTTKEEATLMLRLWYETEERLKCYVEIDLCKIPEYEPDMVVRIKRDVQEILGAIAVTPAGALETRADRPPVGAKICNPLKRGASNRGSGQTKKKSKNAKQKAPEERANMDIEVLSLNEHDCLLGRGGNRYKTEASCLFRVTAKAFSKKYRDARGPDSKKMKDQIVEDALKALQQKKVRFVVQVGEKYFLAKEGVVRTKVKQFLLDTAKKETTKEE